MTPPSARRLVRVAGLAALTAVTTLAAYQRIAYFARGRGLWTDEAALVQSLQTMSFGQLTGPLLDAQSAPLLFVWTTKAVTVLISDSERWLRALPLIAGLATLPATIALTRLAAGRGRRISWFGACLPVGATAFSAQIVFYSAQVKPYTVDMAAVALLLVLAQVLGHRGLFAPAARRWRIGFIAAALVLPWLSAGAMLCVGPIVIWLVVVAARRDQHGLRQWRTHPGWWAGVLVVAASDLGCALRAALLTGTVPAFDAYWSAWLSPASQGRGFGLAQFWRWHVFVLRDFLQQDLGSAHPWLLAAVLLAGWLCLLRRDAGFAVLLLLPAATVYAAALAGQYPFARRLALFVLPPLLTGLGALFDDAVRTLAWVTRTLACRLSRRTGRAPGRDARLASWRWAAAGVLVAAVTVAAAPAVTAGPTRLHDALRYSLGIDDYKPALEFVARKRVPTDVLVVGLPDRVVTRVYAHRLGIPTASIAVAILPTHLSTAPTSTHCPLPARMRTAHSIWIVSSNVTPVGGILRRVWLRQPLQATHYVVYADTVQHVSVLRLQPTSQGTPIDTPCPTYRTLGPAGADAFAQPRFG